MNDLLVAAAYLLGYPVALGACYYLVTLLHEMGHALVALAVTTGPVVAHVGSYGQATASSRQWQLGRLRLHLYWQPRWWRSGGGYCQHEPVAHRWQSILILLAGPALPPLVGGLALGYSLLHPNGWWRLPLLLFVLLAASTSAASLLKEGTVKLADGRVVKNDGGQIREHLCYPARHRLPWLAHERAQAGQFAEAARCYEQLLQHHGPADALYRGLLDCYWLAGRLEVALSVSQQFEQALPARFTDDNLFRRGSLLSHLGRHQVALALYEQLLTRPVPYADAYNNRGYTRSLLGEQAAAVADFERAIALHAAPAYAYASRGLARLRQGQPAEALADIAHALALNPAEAYGYRNRGIYHLGRNEHAAALADFERARQLNPLTHGLDDYLRQARPAPIPASA